jgi:hypothetical protein
MQIRPRSGTSTVLLTGTETTQTLQKTRGASGERGRGGTGIEDAIFGHDAIADVDAFVTDKVPGRARDELRDVLLRLVAERAMKYGTVRTPRRVAGPIPKRHDDLSLSPLNDIKLGGERRA